MKSVEEGVKKGENIVMGHNNWFCTFSIFTVGFANHKLFGNLSGSNGAYYSIFRVPSKNP